MAWQYGVAQTVAATMYSGGEPTAPTGALTATISKDGAGFGAIAGTVAQIGATPCVLLSLTIADMTCATGVVRIVDAGGAVDDRYVEFCTEADYTAAVAARIDDYITSREASGAAAAAVATLNDFDPSADTVARVTLVDTTTVNTDMRGTDGAYTGTPPTASSIAQAVWEYGTRTLTSITALAAQVASAVWDAVRATYNTAGTMGAGLGTAAASGNITLSAQSTDITVDAGEAISGSGAISVVRDDDSSLQIEWKDHDITGYSIYLTVRPTEHSSSTDDTDAVFQVAAALTTPGSGIFTFGIGKTQTDECDVDRQYRYDIQAISDTGAITTLLKGPFTVTGDVTRRTS